jgi:desulfoferrodoxin (superoxide reductase-like protein)
MVFRPRELNFTILLVEYYPGMQILLAIALMLAASSGDAFAPTSSVNLHRQLFVHIQVTDDVKCHAHKPVATHTEIDRRSAMLNAVTIASGALSLSPNPASAKSAIFSLEAKVTDIEKKNLATKNSNGDPIKHTAVVTIEDSTTMAGKVVRFTVPHVMDAEKPHYIEYMWLEDVSGKQRKPPGNIVAVKAFKPTDASPPTLIENVAAGKLPTLKAGIVKGMLLKPCLFCNIHGLWEGDPVPIV